MAQTLIRRGNYVNPGRMAELQRRTAEMDRNRRRTYPFSTEVSLDAIKAMAQRQDRDDIWLKVHGEYRNISKYGIGDSPEPAWQAYRASRSELLQLINDLQRNPINKGTTSNGVLNLLSYYTNDDVHDIDLVVVGESGQQ